MFSSFSNRISSNTIAHVVALGFVLGLSAVIAFAPVGAKVFAQETPPADGSAPPAEGGAPPVVESSTTGGSSAEGTSGAPPGGEAAPAETPPPAPPASEPSQGEPVPPPPVDTVPPSEGASGSQSDAQGVPAQEGSAGDGATSASSGAPDGQPGAPGGGGLILTGDAAAAANVLNVINANIVSSEGFISFINLFRSFFGDINLSNLVFPFDGCEDLNCQLSGIRQIISNTNVASVVNDVTVTADTGSNTASGEGSAILTGSSAASANVVNVVNANIIGSNYMLLVLNNFNQWAGSLILPGKDFFTSLLNQPRRSDANLLVGNENEAVVTNDVSTIADAGSNTIGSSTAGGTILTGNAQSGSNVLNLVNTNILDSDSVYIIVRVFGRWTGNVFSTPPGISWQETPGGIALFSDPTSGGGSSECCGGSLTVSNSNSADIQNRIRVYALTGENRISGGGGNAVIATGNASAISNTVNVANTNIIGRNWLIAIINIFGDWQGNLAFGQPDLWVGQRAEVTDNPLRPGSEVTYTVDIKNFGNADATNIRVAAEDSIHTLLTPTWMGGNGYLEGWKTRWAIPSLAAGASMRISYKSRLTGDIAPGTTMLANTVQATALEPDANPSDNTDVLDLALQGNPIGTGGGLLPSRLALAKSNNTTEPIEPGKKVGYTIALLNDAQGTAFNVLVRDMLYDPWGTVIASSSWTLGQVYPKEEIYIDYDAIFSANASSGYYINYAYVDGFDNFQGTLAPIMASSSVYILNPNDPTPPPWQPVIFVPPPPPGLEAPLPDSPGNIQRTPRASANSSIANVAFAAERFGELETSGLLAAIGFLPLEAWNNLLLLLVIAAGVIGRRLGSWS